MTDQSEHDKGVKAITTLLEVLGDLKAETRSNVLDYVFRALGITPPVVVATPAPTLPLSPFNPPPQPPALQGATVVDIRTLTDQKQPKTVNQMVAVMAYYLANHAPQAERRDYITAEDIKRYFKPANFPLPTGRHHVTLNNAKNAGYLDAIGEGKFRLNPVGDNLVAHKLPPQEGGASRQPRARKNAKKSKKAKKAKK